MGRYNTDFIELTHFYSSIIVTLDTNMQLSLWTSLKHHLRGEWIKARFHPSVVILADILRKLLDVTQFLKDNFDYDEASSPTVRTMGLQVTGMEFYCYLLPTRTTLHSNRLVFANKIWVDSCSMHRRIFACGRNSSELHPLPEV